MQVNSIEPAAESESSRDGRLVLSYGALQPGDLPRIWLQFEVSPTNVGGPVRGPGNQRQDQLHHPVRRPLTTAAPG